MIKNKINFTVNDDGANRWNLSLCNPSISFLFIVYKYLCPYSGIRHDVSTPKLLSVCFSV